MKVKKIKYIGIKILVKEFDYESVDFWIAKFNNLLVLNINGKLSNTEKSSILHTVLKKARN